MSRFLAPILCVLLLMGLVAERATFHEPTGGGRGYHTRVRRAARAVPYRINAWVGTDEKISRGVRRILHPNVLVTRRYRNLDTGEAVTLLLVQTADARSLLGHYPPVCYPAQGWSHEQTIPREWRLGEKDVPMTEYSFAWRSKEGVEELRVLNFMILPGGGIVRGMAGIEAAAVDYKRKFLGAAQTQLVFDASTPPERRKEIAREIFGACMFWIQTVSKGANDDPAKPE